MTGPTGRSPHDHMVETAQRMLELVKDLGDCADTRQLFLVSARHYRVLFGEFLVAAVVLEGPAGHWRVLPLESPYAPSWGGVSGRDFPSSTDLDAVFDQFGRDVTHRVTHDPLLVPRLIDEYESFAASDNVLAVRLAGLTGAPARALMATPWRRPAGHLKGWLVLGFGEPKTFPQEVVELFTSAVQVTSRMAFYPILVDQIARQERVNHSIRRNLVHDLKTPITVIRGYSETLELPEVGADAEMRTEFLAAIGESCHRLLDDLKDLLEPVGTQWIPQKEEFDLAALVQKAVMAERHTDRAKNHEFIVRGTDEPVIMQGDRRKLRRVIENLLSNAVKYSPGVGKKVAIDVATNGTQAAISFRDQGIGMTPEQLAKVMSEGGRVVDVSMGIEGSGFGLQSCKTVVSAHQGEIRASSVPGVGTTFTVILSLT